MTTDGSNDMQQDEQQHPRQRQQTTTRIATEKRTLSLSLSLSITSSDVTAIWSEWLRANHLLPSISQEGHDPSGLRVTREIIIIIDAWLLKMSYGGMARRSTKRWSRTRKLIVLLSSVPRFSVEGERGRSLCRASVVDPGNALRLKTPLRHLHILQFSAFLCNSQIIKY